MKNLSRLSPRQTAASRQPESSGFDPGLLAYEDVVSLAARLTKKGYRELGADFLAFANNPQGLASVYGLSGKDRKSWAKAAASPQLVAAMPYLAAANLLLRSKTVRREEVAQAVLLIELSKADMRATDQEDEPPMFTD